MNKTRIMAVAVAIAIIVAALAGCSQTSGPAQTSVPATSAATTPAVTTPVTTEAAPPTVPPRELYEFTCYINYDWFTAPQWGQDDTSKFIQDKFNVIVDFQKPEGDPAAKMSIMIASNQLPDVIEMEKDADYLKLATTGKFLALDDYINAAQNYKPKTGTLDLEKINGHTYCYLNFFLYDPKPSGGNVGWAYSTKVYELAGKPALATMEDIYNYAKAVKALNPTVNGGPVIPVMFDNMNNYGAPFIDFGCNNNAVYNFALQGDGTLKGIFNDPAWTEAIVWQNKMVREDLTNKDMLTMTVDQQQEYLSTGRFGIFFGNIMWNLFASNNMRQKVLALGDGNGIEAIDWPVTSGIDLATLKSEPRYSW